MYNCNGTKPIEIRKNRLQNGGSGGHFVFKLSFKHSPQSHFSSDSLQIYRKHAFRKDLKTGINFVEIKFVELINWQKLTFSPIIMNAT